MTGDELEYRAPDAKLVSMLWAGPERAQDIATIHEGLFDPAWDVEAVRAMLDHPAATSLVAMSGTPKVALGFILGHLTADEAEVLSIGVAEPWQRKGLGRRLMEGLIRAVARAEVKTLHLEVADDNTPALVLYHHLGFKEVGRRKDYYVRADNSRADALRLALKL